MEQAACFWSRRLGLIWFGLWRLLLMVQAAALDGQLFNASAFGQDGHSATKADVSRGQVAYAFVVAVVDIVTDEGGDGGPEFTFEYMVFE